MRLPNMTTVAVPQVVSPARTTARQVIVYLATYAARGLYGPFVSLYLISVGFSPVEIGVLAGLSAFVRLVIVPAYSTFVDRHGAHRKLLMSQIGLTSAATFGITLWANKLWLGTMFIGRDLADPPSAALLAQLTITSHGARGVTMYGKLRAMGSLGWGISTLLAGSLITLSSTIFANSRYALLLLISAVINAVVVPLVRAFPERTAATNSRIDKPPKRHPAFWLLMASNFLLYCGMNALGVFSYIYFRDGLGADDAMIGVLAAALGLFEIPWMIWINRIYGRMSTRMALLVGNAGLAMFTLSLALLTDTTLLFPLIAARGLFYALQNISQTVIVTEISHPANVATNQAINWVTMPALAAILTGPLAGWLYEGAGPRLVWALSAFVMLLGGILLVVGRRMIEQAREQRLPLHVN